MDHPAGQTGAAVVRRSESDFASRGVRLFRRTWTASDPERLLVLVHGFAEHSARYDHFGAWFARRGNAVHSYDQRGHGRSEGVRNHVRRFSLFLDDLDLFVDQAREQHPGLPLFLVGHSMGGLIVASYLCERAPAVDGAVTSGAALALSADLSRMRIAAARTLRWVAPRLRMRSGLDASGLSRDPEVVRRYVEDPLVHRSTTTSLASELISAARRTARSAQRVRVPMLLLHGEDDPLCSVAGSRDFHAGLGVEGAALRTYPHLRHEIFNEPEHEQVFGDLYDWLRARRRRGSDAS